ncbi:MAG: transcription termination/antitermination NusG family protein [Verrucomicrobiota bacterium]
MQGLSQFSWFCLRSQPKHEHLAASRLRQDGIEAFSPRIRFKRATRRGPIWVTEALFPNYLFAHFDWHSQFRRVNYSTGVAGILHFGDKWPTIPAAHIDELREKFGDAELHIINPPLEPGENVQIAHGAFQGLSAVIDRVMPSQERVKVLLEFVGRQMSVEIDAAALISHKSAREKIL